MSIETFRAASWMAPVNTGEGWYGVDLDRTLAFYDTWKGSTHIGPPIQKMVDIVKVHLALGEQVRIFTARVSTADEQEGFAIVEAIENWCLEHIGQRLPVTCIKDFDMILLYDDRAISVEPNTGMLLS